MKHEDDIIEGMFALEGKKLRVARRDLEKAADFYRTVLGFQVKDESGAILRDAPNEQRAILLIVDDILGDPSRLRMLPQRSLVCELVVDDFEQRVQAYQDAGCEFGSNRESGTGAGAHYAQFDDPFGHRWSLAKSAFSRTPSRT